MANSGHKMLLVNHLKPDQQDIPIFEPVAPPAAIGDLTHSLTESNAFEMDFPSIENFKECEMSSSFDSHSSFKASDKFEKETPEAMSESFIAKCVTPNDDEMNDTEIKMEKLNELKDIPSNKTPYIGISDLVGQKRRKDSEIDDTLDIKKPLSDEKKIANLRKNIRDVMDENQLDTNTLVAQREESERLARVAEQQKIIREYQRQTAVNRQFVRTQSRVLSLLQSGKTFAKITDLTEDSSVNSLDCEKSFENTAFATPQITATEKIISLRRLPHQSDTFNADTKASISDISDKDIEINKGEGPASDIVTIEDSSSEDDCILLSDDEEDQEEEIEDDPSNSGLHVKDTYNVPDELGRVVVNIGHPESEDDIFMAPQIAATIKPHQIGGVRFLFDNIIESTKRFKSSSGFGCILAHSMGLGKTLQVVCFCDIFLRHTPSKTVLCVMPINTLQNWVSEFNTWTPRTSENPDQIRPRQFDVFVLNDQQKTLSARAKVVLKWAEKGGVLLIGYELFRLLALKLIPTRRRRGSNKNFQSENSGSESNKRLMEGIHQALVKPGPDLVICDEGHRIKNAQAGISLALKQIRTRRRIVLTGYPLQNNLLEYWCMVDFVRPNYLGTRIEFCNMFERPIQNGQCNDSTPEDIKLMRFRAHVLHSLLVGFVQRRSHTVLQQTLPQKLEYVILTRMTPFQRQLYDTFMNDVVRSKTVPNPLKAFAVCCKIWNHPDVLYNFLKKRETDIDLEIDDSEVVGEVPNPSGTTGTVKPKKCEESSSTTLDESTPITAKMESVPITDPIPATADGYYSGDTLNSSKLETGQLNINASCSNQSTKSDAFSRSYDNMYYLQNCYQPSNSVLSYSPDFNGNSYWQDPNSTYYNSQAVPRNIGFTSEPDYVGIVVNKTLNQSGGEDNYINKFSSSSEIVDLDTKEIKTVETDIDMGMKPITKSESLKVKYISSHDKEITKQKEKSNDTAPTDILQEEFKVPIKPSAVGVDKDIPKVKNDDGIPYEWAVELMKTYEADLITNSPKMEIFFCILNESVKLGDRVLLFSQSLLTLNLIEKFLQSNHIPDSDTNWTRNVSYFRLDGSTTSQDREKLVNEFNGNTSLRLFLISTRAGSLGINLVGANRVIVFDASWNPCHDTQAVYRIYRYGQTKPCYVYRIVMDKCLEKKIYDRQIKKQGMSDRVVDECNPDAHLSMKDVTNLCHDYDETDNNQTDLFTQPIDSYLDKIIQKIVEVYKHSLSKEPFYHDSLLIDRKEKKLSQAEKRQAHRGYEIEKKASIKTTLTSMTNKIQYRIVRNDGTVVTRPVASIRPMQAVKSNNVVKTGGVRSTRWIPAEVWQRQGMTAQEMTLPLDVVIPTNSNDKSNIILKAGQRVMVLKSAKGIYMQLDSGKIIAIRTSSKASEANKAEKEEIIDITSEGDGTSDIKSGPSKEATSKSNECTSYALAGTENENKYHKVATIDGDAKCSSAQNVRSISPKASKGTAHHLNPHQSHLKTISQRTTQSSIEKCNQVKTFAPSSNIKKGLKTSAIYERESCVKHVNEVMVKKTNLQNYLKRTESAEVKDDISKCDSSQKCQSSLLQQQQQQNHCVADVIKTKTLIHRQDIKKSFPEFTNKCNNTTNNIYHYSTVADNLDKANSSLSADPNLSNSKMSFSERIDQNVSSNKLNRNQAITESNVKIPATELTNNTYFSSKQVDTLTNTESTLQKDINKTTESFQSTYNSNFTEMKSANAVKNSVEYLTNNCTSPQHINSSEPVQMLEQSLYEQPPQAHLEQNPKTHVYMPHYPLMQTTQLTPSSELSQSNRVAPRMNHNYSQYYDAMYDSNKMGNPCDYPVQMADHPAYGAYSHPHYHSPFHTSANAPATHMVSNPYIHWPLVSQTPINEQCNAMYPSTYSQNGAQSNQWNHQ